MSSFLTTTSLLLLLCVLFPIATRSATTPSTAYIRDEDGEPMLNGGTYYILPQAPTKGGGLTAVSANAASTCPLYIAQESDPNSNGLPVKISSHISSKYLPYGSTVFSFLDTTTSCTEPLVWRATPDSSTGEFYLTAGETDEEVDLSAFNIVTPFNYVNPWDYEISVCNKLVCKGAGIHENGLLGLKDGVDFRVQFRKAFHGTSEYNSVM